MMFKHGLLKNMVNPREVTIGKTRSTKMNLVYMVVQFVTETSQFFISRFKVSPRLFMELDSTKGKLNILFTFHHYLLMTSNSNTFSMNFLDAFNRLCALPSLRVGQLPLTGQTLVRDVE